MPPLNEPPNEYLNTVGRMEPDITMVDAGAFYASASISLKRIADSLARIETILETEHTMRLRHEL